MLHTKTTLSSSGRGKGVTSGTRLKWGAYLREEGVPQLAAWGRIVCSVNERVSCLYGCMFCEVELDAVLICVRIVVLDHPMVCPVFREMWTGADLSLAKSVGHASCFQLYQYCSTKLLATPAHYKKVKIYRHMFMSCQCGNHGCIYVIWGQSWHPKSKKDVSTKGGFCKCGRYCWILPVKGKNMPTQGWRRRYELVNFCGRTFKMAHLNLT